MNWKILLFAISAAGLGAVETWAQSSGGRWPSLFSKGSDESEYVEPVEIGDAPPRQRWGSAWGQWNWRPRAWEWKQPAFMQRMNENSARSWRNTRRGVSNWMSQTGSSIRETTYDTWDSITRAANPNRTAQNEDDVRPVPPGNGRVNDFLSRPRVKF